MGENFVSAGNLEKSKSIPTITFLCKNDTKDSEQKPEYKTVNAEDYQSQSVKADDSKGFRPEPGTL